MPKLKYLLLCLALLFGVIWGIEYMLTKAYFINGDDEVTPESGLASEQYSERVALYSEIELANKQIELEMVRVPGGCYQMGDTFGDGDSDEKPVHKVCVDSFQIGKTEVTQGQWQTVMDDNPSEFKKGNTHPVERVSWQDVQGFISKLSSKTGKQYRLPTEAEWEYAARSGGRKEKYAGGNVGAVAWYDDNSGNTTHPVALKRPNGLGLYDMSGNVWEWCQDWYDEDYYKNSPRNNPRGPKEGPLRVLRGGSWDNSAERVRAAYRAGDEPGFTFNSLGFRLVLLAGQ